MYIDNHQSPSQQRYSALFCIQWTENAWLLECMRRSYVPVILTVPLFKAFVIGILSGPMKKVGA